MPIPIFNRLSSRLRTLGAPYYGHPLRTFVAAAKLVCFTHLFFEYGFSASPCSGPSMLPTFDVLGEWLLVSKLHRQGRGVEIGDLVVYHIPINDTVGVKRVLGLPGDYVLADTPLGHGHEHGHHHAAVHGDGGDGEGREAMIQVPPGHCWIVGDNLTASRDSRSFGPVPLALVRGKVVGRFKNPWSITWIENPMMKKRLDQ